MASNKEDKAPHPAAAATEDVPAATAQVTRPQPPIEETGCECKPAVIMHPELLLAACHGDLPRLRELLNGGDGPAAPTAAATQIVIEVDRPASSTAATSLLEGNGRDGPAAPTAAATQVVVEVDRPASSTAATSLLEGNGGDGPAAPTAAATQVVVEVDRPASSTAATSLLEGNGGDGPAAPTAAATQVVVEVDRPASSTAATSLLEGNGGDGPAAPTAAATQVVVEVDRPASSTAATSLLEGNGGDGPAAPTAAATQVVVEVDRPVSSTAATSLLEGNGGDGLAAPTAAATQVVVEVDRPASSTAATSLLEGNGGDGPTAPTAAATQVVVEVDRHASYTAATSLLEGNGGDGPAAPTAAATQVVVEVDRPASSTAVTSLLEGNGGDGPAAPTAAGTQVVVKVDRPVSYTAATSLLEENGGEVPAAPTAEATQVVVEVERSVSSTAATSLLEGATFQGDSALHVVATSGDDDKCLESASLICSKAKHLLEALNNNGDTPLHCASRAGRVKMVSHLIELVGDDDGHEQKVKKLLEKQNNRHETVLHEAVRLADEDLISKLMLADPELALVPIPKDDNSPLYLISKLMLADPELARVPKDDISPLYLAIMLGHVNVAKLLHGYDEELSYSGPNGQNALHAAVLRNEETTRMLLQWNKGLAEKGDKHGRTPLHFAASLETLKISTVKIFFASYFIRFRYLFGNVDGLTSLIGNMNGLTAMLMDANKSSAYQLDNKGVFPIHIAASAGKLHVLDILFKKSPDCANLLNARGRTFLHVAVEKNRHFIIRFTRQSSLLASGFMNMQDNDGNTALHLAVQDGNMWAFFLLLMNPKVEINYLNNEGLTPLDISLRRIPKGLHHGSNQRSWILESLRLANAQPGYSHQDHSKEKCICKMVGEKEEDSQSKNDDEKGGEQEDSKAMTEATQVLGFCSVLIATATFAAAFTLPGGYDANGQANGGRPTLAGTYSFDVFIVALTLAFICALLATFSLTYSGVAKIDYEVRLKYLNSSENLVRSSIRSFVAAFAFGLYVVLAPVAHKTAILVCVICFAALLYDHTFLDRMLFRALILHARVGFRGWLTLGREIFVIILRPFWSYVIIFGWPAYLKWRHQR